jgi:hydrogenase expression/formation protein HypC
MIITKGEMFMCLAIPGIIVSIDESNNELKMAKVNFGGVQKDICIQWLDEVQVGDYVLAHVGFALNKIDQKDAEETIEILKQMGDIQGTEE